MKRPSARPLETYDKTWLGVVALTLAAMLVIGVVLWSRLPQGLTHYQAEFAQAAALRPGDLVTIAGISVGTVGELKLDADRVVVDFTARDDVHLGSATRAAIKLTTILGSRYLELTPGGDGQLDHHLIPRSATAVPYDLQKTLADSATTFEQIDADRIATSLHVLSQGLNGLPDALPESLANLRSLSRVIADRRSQISTLLKSTDTLTTMIRDQKAHLGSLIVQGRDLLAEVVARRDALKRLFDGTTALIDKAHDVVNDEPQIAELLTKLNTLTAIMAQRDTLLRNTLQALPAPIRNITNATGSASALDLNLPAGPLIDSWMCAISGRGAQFNLPQYFQDCQ